MKAALYLTIMIADAVIIATLQGGNWFTSTILYASALIATSHSLKQG